GLRFRVVQSDTGMMGGLGAHEFMAPSAAGEDEIAICDGCGYAANVELARGVPEAPTFPAWTREEVATPNAKTIAEVAAYLKIAPVRGAEGGAGARAPARRPQPARAQARAGARRRSATRASRRGAAIPRGAGGLGRPGRRPRADPRRRDAARGDVRRRRQP